MTSPNASEPKTDWFDRLPKKLRIILLMVFTSAVSAMFFFSGVHAYRSGQSSDYAGHQDLPGTDFLWSLFWLGITALLLAVYLGWFERKNNDQSK